MLSVSSSVGMNHFLAPKHPPRSTPSSRYVGREQYNWKQSPNNPECVMQACEEGVDQNL